jgi:DNA-binding MarR family transcriptional regulator
VSNQNRDAEQHTEFSHKLSRAISRLNRMRKRFMNEHLKEYGISGSQYMFIIALNKNPGSSQDYLAEHYYKDKGLVARSTKRLEELGYITRETDPNDKRQNNLYLTEKGKELVPHIYSLMNQWAGSAVEGLTADECNNTLKILESMLENCSTLF